MVDPKCQTLVVPRADTTHPTHVHAADHPEIIFPDNNAFCHMICSLFRVSYVRIVAMRKMRKTKSRRRADVCEKGKNCGDPKIVSIVSTTRTKLELRTRKQNLHKISRTVFVGAKKGCIGDVGHCHAGSSTALQPTLQPDMWPRVYNGILSLELLHRLNQNVLPSLLSPAFKRKVHAIVKVIARAHDSFSNIQSFRLHNTLKNIALLGVIKDENSHVEEQL